MRLPSVFVLLACSITLPDAAPAAQDSPPASLKLDGIEARLFYKGSGRLSVDLLAPENHFDAWNTIIGAGSAKEPADDVIVSARLTSSDGREKMVRGPVVLTARNAKWKVLGTRTWRHVLTSQSGVVLLPLWLNDVGCAGELRITAQYNGATRSRILSLPCGE